MTPFIRIAAIVILSLACLTEVHAGPKPGPGKSGPAAKTTTTKTITLPTKAKTSAKSVQAYQGKSRHHWGPIRWDRRYGCYCYWDPCMLQWYYWCEPDDCYYPVSYCPYRTYADVGVPETAAPASLPAPRDIRTTIRPDAPQSAPVSRDIPPIPEPLAPRE